MNLKKSFLFAVFIFAFISEWALAAHETEAKPVVNKKPIPEIEALSKTYEIFVREGESLPNLPGPDAIDPYTIRWKWVDEPATAETLPQESMQNMPGNAIVLFFDDAELQVETKSQLREIQRAFNDMLNLPEAQLRRVRYADYTLTPNQWTLERLLKAYFVSDYRGVFTGSAFYKDMKKPEAIEVLKKRLQEIKAAIPDAAGD